MTAIQVPGTEVIRVLRHAVAHLEAHADEVDTLNVFPVPDGDTGRNMAATARAALEEADAVADEDRTLPEVARAISRGALMGARGNSGVILSQILRGMAEAAPDRSALTGLDLAFALRRGSQTAYAAIVSPVEGTILTVVRETAEAALGAAEREPDLRAVLGVAVDAARASVERTPSLLPILAESGVVDSGGQGLFRLLEGAWLALDGRRVADGSRAVTVQRRSSAARPHQDEGFGYETMFVVTAGPTPLDPAAIRRDLEAMGESVLVAGDERAIKVHVHNERPDAIIAYGLGLGALSRITVENLDQQSAAVAESRDASGAGRGVEPVSVAGHPGLGARVAADDGTPTDDEWAPVLAAWSASAQVAEPAVSRESAERCVVSVAIGEGLATAMASAGAVTVHGGRTANPSAGELAQAIRDCGSPEVVVLPNDPNVRLAAHQATHLVPGVRVEVVPTRTPAEGIAAMLAFDARQTLAENARTMAAAAARVRTLAVTVAVRDARIGDRAVRRGETIVIDASDRLVTADEDCRRAVVEAARALDSGFELLSLYVGAEADPDETASLADGIREALDGVEVEVIEGGQPHPRYLIAVE